LQVLLQHRMGVGAARAKEFTGAAGVFPVDQAVSLVLT